VYSIAQVALSLTLLIATGLLLRALQRVERADPGFARDHRLSINLYGPPEAWDGVLQRARAVGGVQDATLAHSALGPAGGGCASLSSLEAPRRIDFNIVEPNYFETMRVPIVRGAGFTDAPGVLVNETMARQWWAGEDPLGKMLWLGCNPAKRTVAPVIGVARDTTRALDADRQPAYYAARRETAGAQSFALIVRTASEPYQWSRPLLDALATVPDLHIYEVASLEDTISLEFWEMRWQAALLGGLGALAIVLAAIGLYGVVACSVAQRTREIGVRMAIGAQAADVQWMFLGHALRTTTIGVAVGLALSVATARLMRGYLYGLSPFDPVAFAGASLAWLLIAMMASWWPARRATRVDPLTALKYE
jgi:predicted permease